MIKALTKAAGILSLYGLVTRQPPTMVAALLAKVNLKNHSTGSVIPKNCVPMFCGVLYLDMRSKPIRKNPKALANASWCFCREGGERLIVCWQNYTVSRLLSAHQYNNVSSFFLVSSKSNL